MLCVHRSAFVNDSWRCRPKCFHYIFRCRQAGLAKSMACLHEYLFYSLRLSKLGLSNQCGFAFPRVPPPTRGWPRRHHARRTPPHGAPAHAGMAPTTCPSPPSPTWCPRPRGDGPAGITMKTKMPKVPPPTRGWPGQILRDLVETLGAPAHAGMAPLAAPPVQLLGGCPRPRGDGPR